VPLFIPYWVAKNKKQGFGIEDAGGGEESRESRVQCPEEKWKGETSHHPLPLLAAARRVPLASRQCFRNFVCHCARVARPEGAWDDTRRATTPFASSGRATRPNAGNLDAFVAKFFDPDAAALVPEPSALVLALLGVGGIVTRWRH